MSEKKEKGTLWYVLNILNDIVLVLGLLGFLAGIYFTPQEFPSAGAAGGIGLLLAVVAINMAVILHRAAKYGLRGGVLFVVYLVGLVVATGFISMQVSVRNFGLFVTGCIGLPLFYNIGFSHLFKKYKQQQAAAAENAVKE